MIKAEHAGSQQVAQHGNKGHTGAQAVQTIRQVDGIDQKDDAEERNGVIHPAQIYRTDKGQHNDGGQQALHVQPHQEAAGNNELHDKLLPGKQAQVAVLDDLDIVIQKTDKAGTKRQEQRQQGGAHLHNAQKVLCIAVEPGIYQAAGHQNAKDEAQAAHGGCALFFVMPGRAGFPDGLAEVQLVQCRNYKTA